MKVSNARSLFSSASLRAVLVSAVAGVLLVMGTPPAQAATGKWYRIPDYNGAVAWVNMTSFTKSWASGHASGRVAIDGDGSNRYYVKLKPIEGGLWQRATSSVTNDGSYVYLNWSDDFFLNYSGYSFRLCRDRWGYLDKFDPCGSAVSVTG